MLIGHVPRQVVLPPEKLEANFAAKLRFDTDALLLLVSVEMPLVLVALRAGGALESLLVVDVVVHLSLPEAGRHASHGASHQAAIVLHQDGREEHVLLAPFQQLTKCF